MSRVSPARTLALDALERARREGSYVRDVLSDPGARRGIDPRDAALALRLALGVTATRGCLDELLDRCLDKPSGVKPVVRQALRISAFELVYLKTAPEVAVSQGVELVRSRARYAAGMANAVLRRVAADREAYLSGGDAPASAARRAGLPAWLASAISESIGAGRAGAMLSSALEPPPAAIHARPGFDASGVLAASPSAFEVLPGTFSHVEVGSAVCRDALASADAVASDLNAQLVAASAVGEGSCLEIGAGRGTKTYVMASLSERLGFRRRHVAVDLSARKCALNAERLERSGLAGGVSFASGDARDLDAVLGDAASRELFDTVFVDAPCSGTGTMRRHPEIPWRLDPKEAFEGLPELQLELMREASRRVAPAGRLVYATCSVLAGENHGVVEAFLASPEGSGFALAPMSQAPSFSHGALEGTAEFARLMEAEDGTFQSAPFMHNYDGHFCAHMVRTGA